MTDSDQRPSLRSSYRTIGQRFESRLPIRLTRRLQPLLGRHLLSAEITALARLRRQDICGRSAFRGWELLADGNRVVWLPLHGLPVVAAAIIGCFARPCLVGAADPRGFATAPRHLALFDRLGIHTAQTGELSSKAPPILAAKGIVLLIDGCGESTEPVRPELAASCLDEITSPNARSPIAAACWPRGVHNYQLDVWESATSADTSARTSSLESLMQLIESSKDRPVTPISKSS